MMTFLSLAAFVAVVHGGTSTLGSYSTIRRYAPPVVMWMVLGPMIGTWLPDLFSASQGWIKVLGNIGLVLFGLATGMHIDCSHLRRQGWRIATMSIVGFAVALLFGSLAGAYFVATWPNTFIHYQPVVIELVTGLLTAAVALPVLSAIVHFLHLAETSFGKIALTTATLKDILVWPLVGVVGTLAAMKNHHGHVGLTILAIVAYLAVMFAVVPPILRRLERYLPDRRCYICGVALVLLYCSSHATEELGLHSLLGAVILGVVLPNSFKCHCRWLEAPTLHGLMPFFVVGAGAGIRLGSVNPMVWQMLIILIIVTLIGNYLGTVPVARLVGYSWREATSFMPFTICKGVVEFAIAGALFAAGAMPRELYDMAILYAIALTVLTPPLAQLVLAIVNRQPDPKKIVLASASASDLIPAIE